MHAIQDSRLTTMPMTLTPYLSFHDCAAAIRFYEKAFGAVETGARFTDGDGRIGHAEISIGGNTVFVSDEYPDFDVHSPKSLGGTHVALHLQVDDADAAAERLVAAGAEVKRPVEAQADGERRGTFLDPFGYRWMIGEQVETVTREELAKRVDSNFKVD